MGDFNGVSMALMADTVPEKHLRGVAMSVTIALVLIVCLSCMGLTAVLPVSISFYVALIAATVKLVFYFTLFPETVAAKSDSSWNRQSPAGAVRAAFRLITKNDFILRMAWVAMIGAISSVGSGIVIQPYLTGYIGMDHKQLSGLMSIVIVSVLLTLGPLAKPITEHCGDVR